MDLPDGPIDDSEAEFVRSARGWNGVQLAALAFIGLCGVLSSGGTGAPRWVQIVAGGLALLALGLACSSIFLVASVAWPLSSPGGRQPHPHTGGGDRAVNRLRLGVIMTFAAVAAMALAASSGWWPVQSAASADTPSAGSAAAVVEITDGNGRTACGELVDAPAGAVRLDTSGGRVELAIARMAAIGPATGC
ncbi:MAG: hypothetical protein ABW328_04465 [Ilumatobacteraceae bacterium]